CLFAARTGQARGQNPSKQEKNSKQEGKPKSPPVSSHVILISVNGLRSDFVTNAESYRLRIPAIQSLRAGGASAVGIESGFPSQPLPAHAAMVTGTLPADHGVTSDYAFDVSEALQSKQPYETAKSVKTDTIYDLAARSKLITAAVGFPLTSGAAMSFNLPDD